jgi:hypothetical protein
MTRLELISSPGYVEGMFAAVFLSPPSEQNRRKLLAEILKLQKELVEFIQPTVHIPLLDFLKWYRENYEECPYGITYDFIIKEYLKTVQPAVSRDEDKNDVITKLWQDKSESNNRIDLEAYSSGLEDMYDYLISIKQLSRKEAEEMATKICGTTNIYSNDPNVLPKYDGAMAMYAWLQSWQPKATDKWQKLADDIRQWSDATFGNQRNPGIAYHLKKEVDELINAIIAGTISQDLHNRKILMEYADCMMLLLDSATHSEFTVAEIYSATIEKLEINKNRKWGSPDENGVVEHIEHCEECGYPLHLGHCVNSSCIIFSAPLE